MATLDDRKHIDGMTRGAKACVLVGVFLLVTGIASYQLGRAHKRSLASAAKVPEKTSEKEQTPVVALPNKTTPEPKTGGPAVRQPDPILSPSVGVPGDGATGDIIGPRGTAPRLKPRP